MTFAVPVQWANGGVSIQDWSWALGCREAPGDPPGHMLPEEEEAWAQRRPGAEEVRHQPGAQEGAIRERKTPPSAWVPGKEVSPSEGQG